jgi:hypothetical protein
MSEILTKKFSDSQKTLFSDVHAGYLCIGCVYTRASCVHTGCSEPGHMHTWAALLIGRVPIDRLISVEDCYLISVGAENVS